MSFPSRIACSSNQNVFLNNFCENTITSFIKLFSDDSKALEFFVQSQSSTAK